MDHIRLDEIFAVSPLVEAVILVSKDGLPLAWRCRCDISVEEIASMITGLYSLGFELDLAPDKKTAQLFVDADHGAMLAQAMPDTSLLLVLTARGCSMKEIEMKLQNDSSNNSVSKEVQYGKNGQRSSC